jgi:hypothetical protein
VVLLYTCEGEERNPRMDTLDLFRAYGAFLAIVRYTLVDIEWRWTLVYMRWTFGSTLVALRWTLVHLWQSL